MAAQTGRTVDRWVKCYIDDSGGTLREIYISSINGVGLAYEEVDLVAFIDAVKGVLLGQPDFSCDITFPFDNTATTGAHTVLSGVNGGNTPLAFDVRIGIRHTWESGEPTFGITGTAANGVVVSDYKYTGGGMGSAKIRMFSGSAAPEWNTTAHT